jgi:hypothetical protein
VTILSFPFKIRKGLSISVNKLALDNKYCSKCSYPLTPQAFEEIKNDEEIRIYFIPNVVHYKKPILELPFTFFYICIYR